MACVGLGQQAIHDCGCFGECCVERADVAAAGFGEVGATAAFASDECG